MSETTEKNEMPTVWIGRSPILLSPSYVRALHIVVCLDNPRNDSEQYIPASRLIELVESWRTEVNLYPEHSIKATLTDCADELGALIKEPGE